MAKSKEVPIILACAGAVLLILALSALSSGAGWRALRLASGGVLLGLGAWNAWPLKQ